MTAQTRLRFELDQRAETGFITAHAGVPLMIEACRTSGAAAVLDAGVVIERRMRGLAPSALVEGLFSLWAAGGERCDDVAVLREASRSGPTTEVGPGSKAWEPGKRWRCCSGTACRRPGDATILDSRKRAARWTDDGGTGHQPVVALRAEQDVILADECRDGNLPAGTGNRRLVEQALAALPAGVELVRLRGDSALYEQSLLRWLEARGSATRSVPIRAATWRRRSATCPRAPGRWSGKTVTRSAIGPRWRMCRARVSQPRTGRRRGALWRVGSPGSRAGCLPTAARSSTSRS
jgi:hypothetical protein